VFVSTETIVGGTATSDPFVAGEPGFYCFRIVYNPAQGSPYAAAEHTNQTTECFEVVEIGSITIIKDVPGTSSQNFSFSDNIPGCNIGTLDDDPGSGTPKSVTCGGLEAGTYTVSENLPSGWSLDDIDCNAGADVDIDESDEEVTIFLGANEDVTCTFDNEEDPFIPDPPTPVPPTPAPTLVAEVQPIQEVLVTPPQTGDGGLADGGSSRLAILLTAAAALAGSALLGLRLGRRAR
jgi:hypothetical protein